MTTPTESHSEGLSLEGEDLEERIERLAEEGENSEVEKLLLLLPPRIIFRGLGYALLGAIRGRNINQALLYLRRGAGLKLNALDLAAENGDRQLVDLLLSLISRSLPRAIIGSARGGHDDLCRELIQRLVTPQGDTFNDLEIFETLSEALGVAAGRGHQGLVLHLLTLLSPKLVEDAYQMAMAQAMADEESNAGYLAFTQTRAHDPYRRALGSAAYHGQSNLVHFLLSDPGRDDPGALNFAFLQAAGGGHQGLVEELLRKKPSNLPQAHLRAIVEGQTEVAEWLKRERLKNSQVLIESILEDNPSLYREARREYSRPKTALELAHNNKSWRVARIILREYHQEGTDSGTLVSLFFDSLLRKEEKIRGKLARIISEESSFPPFWLRGRYDPRVKRNLRRWIRERRIAVDGLVKLLNQSRKGKMAEGQNEGHGSLDWLRRWAGDSLESLLLPAAITCNYREVIDQYLGKAYEDRIIFRRMVLGEKSEDLRNGLSHYFKGVKRTRFVDELEEIFYHHQQ